jgi:hypothetical protein
MLLVFGYHDYKNGYFYRVRIRISYGNYSSCYLKIELVEIHKGSCI